VTRRPIVAISGAGAVGIYVALALFSGHLSVLARRPLLEGTGPPPVYRWVNPPPNFAAVNMKPGALKETVDLTQSDRGAGLHGTPDRQAQLVIDPNSFPPNVNGRLTLTIDPLDPGTLDAAPPGGQEITGNAYKIRLATADGKDAPGFTTPAHLVLQYPTPTGLSFVESHTVVRLEGSVWTPLQTTDAPAAQQATAETTELGTFSVVFKAAPKAKPKPKAPVGLIVVLAVVVVAGTAVIVTLRSRRAAAKARARRKAKGKGRR